ncbi:MAG: hypothetical protein GY778_12385, partial [bacterium]|nr:hypothetical protein [bacterium]
MSGGWAMLGAFVWPGLFAASVAGVSAPILIHLLARRRFKRVRWAAIEFVIEAQRRNRRRVRLEEAILLLLRCLAVLLIGTVLARPFLSPQGWAGAWGDSGSGQREHIFLLDDSYSMGFTAGGATRFAQAKRELIGLLDRRRQQSGGDLITVWRSSALDTPLASGIHLDDRSLAELSARIEALEPSQRTLGLDDAVEATVTLLTENPDVGGATLTVVSDFQRIDWVDRPGAGASSDEETTLLPLAPLAEWAEAGHGLNVVLVAVGQERGSNAQVAEIRPGDARFIAGMPAKVEVTIANLGTSEREAGDLHVTAGPSNTRTVAVPSMAAGGRVTVPVDVSWPTVGLAAVRMALPADGLADDDVRTAVVAVDEAVRILVVNGEPSSDAHDDEVKLLTTAMAPAGAVFSGNAVRVIDETELESALSVGSGPEAWAPHLVILANVYRIGEAAVERLEAFVRGGGGLLMYLGDQVDAESYNALLHADGAGLMPVALGPVVQGGAGGVGLAAGDFLHPVVRVFAGRDNPFVARLAFYRFFGVPDEQPPDGKQDTDASAPTVVARYGDGLGTPALIERRFGAGRVLLANTSCDLEWNNWAKDPSYVVAVQELTRHLARRGRVAEELVVGEPIEVRLDPGRYAPTAVLRTPGYPKEREYGLTAMPEPDGAGLLLRWEETDRAGLYRLLLQQIEGVDEERLLAVNVDPWEGDLRAADEAELREAMPGIPVMYLRSADDADVLAEAGRRELWRGILLAALLVLMGEQVLAFTF